MATYKTLKKGSTGEEVARMQRVLIALGYDCGASGADGDYGSSTAAAVRAFQYDKNLKVDGVAGDKTLTALYKQDWAAIGRAYAKTVEAIGKLPEFKTLEVLMYGG